MVIQRGDIWYVAIPSASSGGHEQEGHRPAIIIQDAGYGSRLPLVLVIPLTSQTAADRFPGTFLVQPSATNGLKQPSIALVFQLRALDRSRFVRKVGTLDPAHVDSILAVWDKLTGR